MATVPDNWIAFVKKAYPLAILVQRRYQVPWIVCLAQASVESGWGNKNNPFVQKHNVWFGIKCHGYSRCVHARTREVYTGQSVHIVDSFRSYRTMKEAFLDYGLFLKKYRNYDAAFRTRTPENFVKKIKEGGYATDPNYVPVMLQRMDIIRGIVKKLGLKPPTTTGQPFTSPKAFSDPKSSPNAWNWILLFGASALAGYGAYRGYQYHKKKRIKRGNTEG
jgi:hypothetical protein